MAPTQPLSGVTLYVKRDGAHLYLGFDDPFDVTSSSTDEVSIYFDDNPLPSDGLWGTTTCGNADGEGQLSFTPSSVRFTEWKGSVSCPSVYNPAGALAAFGLTTGHRQVEISIDLTTSALRLLPGDAVMSYLWIRDSNGVRTQGVWPNHAIPNNPSTFHMLTLELAKLFLPFAMR
jgi:hypothetical protein